VSALGFRFWLVEDRHLVSPAFGDSAPWESATVQAVCSPGRTAQATLGTWHGANEPPPGEQCTCGIAATRTLPGLLDVLWIRVLCHIHTPKIAFGVVRLTGRILPDPIIEDSIRGSSGTVLRLWTPESNIEALAETYPAVLVGDLGRMSQEFTSVERRAAPVRVRSLDAMGAYVSQRLR
jgi:hypothetical protein